jgi:translation initiation factor IF-3
VKLRPRTEEHDYDVKIRKIREFLAEANKARVTVTFRGREMSHRELGQKVLQRVMEDLKDVAVIESPPRMEGRLLFMIVAPNPRLMQSQRAKAANAAAAAAAGASAPAEAPPAPAAPAPAPAATNPAGPS